MEKILFVCTGNTCRSPMAEAMMNELLKSSAVLKDKVTAESAGLSAVPHAAMTRSAQTALIGMGIEHPCHEARPITEKILRDAAVILVMEAWQKEALLRFCSDIRPNVFCLKEIVGQQGDISDPYGGSQQVYTDTAWEIRRVLETYIKQLEFEQERGK